LFGVVIDDEIVRKVMFDVRIDGDLTEEEEEEEKRRRETMCNMARAIGLVS
jgi:hypothetical protein